MHMSYNTLSQLSTKQQQKLREMLDGHTLVLTEKDMNCAYTNLDIHTMEIYHVRHPIQDIANASVVILRIGNQQKFLKHHKLGLGKDLIGVPHKYMPEITRKDWYDVVMQVGIEEENEAALQAETKSKKVQVK